MTESTSPVVRRNRLKMLLVAGVFLLPVLAAGILSLADWHPGTRSHGEPILPQRSFKDIRIVMDDGSTYAWRDSEPRMTLLVLPGTACADNCARLLVLLRNARITLNKNQDRLRLLYVGQPPSGARGEAVMQFWRHGRDVDGKLKDFRPLGPDSLAAVLVESNGTALVRYRAGFDPEGVKDDLHKVIR